MAHAGPAAAGTFVHFDADRDWNAGVDGREGDRGHSLRGAALHETGHVLGLGHSPRATALMYAAEDAARSRIAAHDMAGLASLYAEVASGVVADGPGDLFVSSAGERRTALRRVAPPALSDFALLDTDGDGDDEVVLWRTDEAGLGALIVFHFTAGPRLARTAGPALGIVLPGGGTRCGLTEAGEPVIVSVHAGGIIVRTFDDAGRIGAWERGSPFDLDALRPAGREGDLDGDGVPERVTR